MKIMKHERDSPIEWHRPATDRELHKAQSFNPFRGRGRVWSSWDDYALYWLDVMDISDKEAGSLLGRSRLAVKAHRQFLGLLGRSTGQKKNGPGNPSPQPKVPL